MPKITVLFVVPYPTGEAPSQRFRFEQYFPILQASGLTFSVHSFFDDDAWKILYRPGHVWQKLFHLLKGYSKRTALLFNMRGYDFVFIHREAAPFGPPLFEWVAARILRKKIIYDFDDAIWLTDKAREPLLAKWARHRSKVRSICRWSYRISAGNRYLQSYAAAFCKEARVNPTTLDTERHHNPNTYVMPKSARRVTIGWTGSHSTLKYLVLLAPVLKAIEERYHQVDFLVIADRAPTLGLSRMQFIRWTQQNEVSDLLRIDIGIMPLPGDAWSLGKCGFKALQYMALEIPAVASPVGVNTEIIDHGANGFLCSTDEEWMEHLGVLINDAALRRNLGAAGRKTVRDRYSTESNAPNFLSFFH